MRFARHIIYVFVCIFFIPHNPQIAAMTRDSIIALEDWTSIRHRAKQKEQEANLNDNDDNSLPDNETEKEYDCLHILHLICDCQLDL